MESVPAWQVQCKAGAGKHFKNKGNSYQMNALLCTVLLMFANV